MAISGLDKGPFCCGIVGVITLIVAGVSIPLVQYFIKVEVSKQVALNPGTQFYDLWVEPPVPILMQFYVFDLVNPSEVLKGQKPFVNQKGPYTYREFRKKIDILQNENDTISYRQLRWYEFDEDLSVGPESDTFTTANIPLLAVVEAMRYEPEFAKAALSAGLKLTDEHLFVRRSIKDIIWGYEDELLKVAKDVLPSWFYTDVVGILAGKNYTDDGVYNIYSGKHDVSKLGAIDKYNGSSYLPFWTTPYANMVNGSDGTIGPPFISKDQTVYIFASDICRSVYATYNGSAMSPQGISLYRFMGPKAAFASSKENPDNTGFCTPLGHCMGGGVLNVSTCQLVDSFHVPLVVSSPHFYMADQTYIHAVDGMKPNWMEHNTHIDIEPSSGIMMQISKRLQINIYIESSPEVLQMQNVQSVVYPILWLNESAVIDDEHADMIKRMLLTPVRVISAVQYSCISFSSGLLLVILVSLIYTKTSSQADQGDTTDDEPLLND